MDDLQLAWPFLIGGLAGVPLGTLTVERQVPLCGEAVGRGIRVLDLTRRQSKLWKEDLRPSLEEKGISIVVVRVDAAERRSPVVWT